MHGTVTLYIATSMDGYISGKNDDLGFLDIVKKEGEDYGYNEFINSVDVVIMGRKTYDKIMSLVPEFPHADKDCYILTRTPRNEQNGLHFFSGNINELIDELRNKRNLSIFVDGGAEIVNLLMQEKLIDEFIISIIPVFLGTGKKLFEDGLPKQHLKLLSAKDFSTGLIQLHYTKS